MTGGPHRKPQFNIYSTMLIIAFVAMAIGTVFAYLEAAEYGTNKTKGAPPVTMAAPADWHMGLAQNQITLAEGNPGFGRYG